MWRKFFDRFKRKRNEADYQNVVCGNCDTKFSGHFCPNCGQAVKEYDKPFSFLFYNFLGDFFAFDTRFFKTLFALLIKPGFLTKEYFAGRRIRYAPPIRIFIFVSFVLFLMLQTYTNKGLTTVLDSDFKDGKLVSLDSTSLVTADSIFNNVKMEIDEEDKAVADSVLGHFGLGLDTLATSEIDDSSDTTASEDLDFKLNLESFRDTRDLRQTLMKFSNVLEERLEKEEDPVKRMEIREQIRLCRSPESAMAKILQYISWAFFLLLPIFALLLKLIYIRRKYNYMRHLIFSIHIHSFIYLIMIIVVGLYMSLNVDLEVVSSLIVFAIPIYLIIAMKKFYGQRIVKVLVKFVVVSFLYNISFLALVVFAILNALSVV